MAPELELMVGRGRLHGERQICDAVSKLLGKHKVGEHYTVEIRDDGFEVSLEHETRC